MRKMPSPERLAAWRVKAAEKNAVVPIYFEVFPNRVILECGSCGHEFQRVLIPNLNEPTFRCPITSCQARNWVPVYFNLTFY
jgi:hypothetical protein